MKVSTAISSRVGLGIFKSSVSEWTTLIVVSLSWARVEVITNGFVERVHVPGQRVNATCGVVQSTSGL